MNCGDGGEERIGHTKVQVQDHVRSMLGMRSGSSNLTVHRLLLERLNMSENKVILELMSYSFAEWDPLGRNQLCSFLLNLFLVRQS